MTLEQAILQLESLKKLHGGQIEVFCDCPKCGVSFHPDRIVASAVHLCAAKEKPK
jgi:hypothetical protein